MINADYSPSLPQKFVIFRTDWETSKVLKISILRQEKIKLELVSLEVSSV